MLIKLLFKKSDIHSPNAYIKHFSVPYAMLSKAESPSKHFFQDGKVIASIGASKRLLSIKILFNFIMNLSQNTFPNPQFFTLFTVVGSSFLKLIESIWGDHVL